MATTIQVVELARHEWAGQYATGESRLVRRGEKTYLLHDHYCGHGSLEGGALRPFVYFVPADRAEQVQELIQTARDHIDPARPELGTNWLYFQESILPELECCGRQSRLSWAKSL